MRGKEKIVERGIGYERRKRGVVLCGSDRQYELRLKPVGGYAANRLPVKVRRR